MFFFSSRRLHTRCALVTGVPDVCSSELPRTEFLHPADAFMAEDNREGHNPGAAIGDMDIAAAHAADDNPHQRAAGLGIDDRHVPGLDAVGLDEYACLPSCHMFFPSRGSDLAPDAAS